MNMPFWIQGKKPPEPNRRRESATEWETLGDYETEEIARMAIADAGKFPLDRSLRIVKVEVVA